MPSGSGPIVRQALAGATPRQRYSIGGLMVVGGVVLVLLGHAGGVLLAVGGGLLLWRMVRLRRRSHEWPVAAPEGERP